MSELDELEALAKAAKERERGSIKPGVTVGAATLLSLIAAARELEEEGLIGCLFPECHRVAAHCAEHVADQEHEAWRRGWYAGSGGEPLCENPFKPIPKGPTNGR